MWVQTDSVGSAFSVRDVELSESGNTVLVAGSMYQSNSTLSEHVFTLVYDWINGTWTPRPQLSVNRRDWEVIEEEDPDLDLPLLTNLSHYVATHLINDGARIIACGAIGEVQIWSFSGTWTQQSNQILNFIPGALLSCQTSRDGAMCAMGAENHIIVAQYVSNQWMNTGLAVISTGAGAPGTFALSGSGTRLVYVADAGTELHVRDFANNTWSASQMVDLTYPASAVVVSADGLIAALRETRPGDLTFLQFYNADTLLTTRTALATNNNAGLAISGNGYTVASIEDNLGVFAVVTHTWGARGLRTAWETRVISDLTPPPDDQLVLCALSASGTRLALSVRGTSSHTQIYDRDAPVPCFHGSARIELADGTRIFARDVRVGMSVRGIDNRVQLVERVVCTKQAECIFFRPGVIARNVPNETLIVTPNHLLRMPSGQVMRADQVLYRFCRGPKTLAGPTLRPLTVYHIGVAHWTFIPVHGLHAETLSLSERDDRKRSVRWIFPDTVHDDSSSYSGQVGS